MTTITALNSARDDVARLTKGLKEVEEALRGSIEELEHVRYNI